MSAKKYKGKEIKRTEVVRELKFNDNWGSAAGWFDTPTKQKGVITGFSNEVRKWKVGDWIFIYSKNGERYQRCLIVEIECMRNPPDQYFMTVTTDIEA